MDLLNYKTFDQIKKEEQERKEEEEEVRATEELNMKEATRTYT